MSHIQYSCKVGQAAQAQKEVFEAIQQSKSFFILYSWILVQLFTAQTDGPIKKNISKKNKMYTLANPFQVFEGNSELCPSLPVTSVLLFEKLSNVVANPTVGTCLK